MLPIPSQLAAASHHPSTMSPQHHDARGEDDDQGEIHPMSKMVIPVTVPLLDSSTHHHLNNRSMELGDLGLSQLQLSMSTFDESSVAVSEMTESTGWYDTSNNNSQSLVFSPLPSMSQKLSAVRVSSDGLQRSSGSDSWHMQSRRSSEATAAVAGVGPLPDLSTTGDSFTTLSESMYFSYGSIPLASGPPNPPPPPPIAEETMRWVSASSPSRLAASVHRKRLVAKNKDSSAAESGLSESSTHSSSSDTPPRPVTRQKSNDMEVLLRMSNHHEKNQRTLPVRSKSMESTNSGIISIATYASIDTSDSEWEGTVFQEGADADDCETIATWDTFTSSGVSEENNPNTAIPSGSISPTPPPPITPTEPSKRGKLKKLSTRHLSSKSSARRSVSLSPHVRKKPSLSASLPSLPTGSNSKSSGTSTSTRRPRRRNSFTTLTRVYSALDDSLGRIEEEQLGDMTPLQGEHRKRPIGSKP